MDRGEIKYLLSLGQIVGMNQTLVTILMDAFGDAERAWSEYSRWADILPLSKGKRTSLVEARSEVSPEAVEEYRRRLGVKIIKNQHCNHCGLCEKHCPTGAIRNGRISANCIRCLRCVASCPQKALWHQNR